MAEPLPLPLTPYQRTPNMTNEAAQAMAQLDSTYKYWQSWAKANGHERLLAQAVTWSHDFTELDYETDEDKWIMARRVVAFQTAANLTQGLKPEELWQALIA